MPRAAVFADSERLGIAIVTASGLITAACLSALPGTACTAMAEVYARAALNFGSIVIIFLGVYLTIEIVFLGRPELALKPAYSLALAICARAYFAFMLGFFIWSAFASANNLVISTRFCFFGTPAELAEHAHERTALVGPANWWKVFSDPQRMDP